MGLLENYKEQNPEAFREAPKWRPPQEYGFFIRMVMRMSGGRIRDVDRAAYVLAIAAAIILVTSLFFFFSAGSPSKPPSGFEGNIPNLPEYRNPPMPQNFK